MVCRDDRISLFCRECFGLYHKKKRKSHRYIDRAHYQDSLLPNYRNKVTSKDSALLKIYSYLKSKGINIKKYLENFDGGNITFKKLKELIYALEELELGQKHVLYLFMRDYCSSKGVGVNKAVEYVESLNYN